MSQKKSSFNNLDLNNIGNWPQGPKLVFCALLALLILGLSYLLVTRGTAEELDGLASLDADTLRKETGLNLTPTVHRLRDKGCLLRNRLVF